MTILLTVVHIIVCFILILVILLQAGRGQGLTGASFGSGNVQSLFGTRAADFLTKATSVAAICFLFTCIGLNVIETQKSKSLFEATQKTAPVDIDTIKKALEKVKAEKTQTAATTPAQAGTPAAESAGTTPASSQPAATATTLPGSASPTSGAQPSQMASGEAKKNPPISTGPQTPANSEPRKTSTN